MICQVCKAPLPFKLDDGSYYFEKVEFIEELKKRHLENYLAHYAQTIARCSSMQIARTTR